MSTPVEYTKLKGERMELEAEIKRQKARAEAVERERDDWRKHAEQSDNLAENGWAAAAQLEATLAVVRGVCQKVTERFAEPSESRLAEKVLAILDGEGEK